ncbi:MULTISPECIES: ABC transporter ATP-binding protein [Roseobacter]|uniref:High-affinity branched-chain amino acid transport ATP-binding protein n=1 Tax=Roseobacter litoralis (strain ATCC 49566 / DSM 6996 / JCM 21268 / NBRC 15278 / OCh 149) TaxID=391595 RepID=F7ZLN1_ROSLO|nr:MULTISPECIES: ABC transporter ATP-binding protein [Roseobacter]AEI94082.1 putative high-affinity branched-chain amino acid transport ATP-binding protein [Roseobacter litoralis Och 149]GIT86059.1 ABC transporter ATP-binding protein [Roseobacter sp. OBYS 0001]
MILEIDKLHAGYIKGSLVLQDLNLSIAQGDFVALLGRNGMGKTTLMRSIVGQIKASAGSIRFAGEDITGASSYKIARAGIGYVPQGREIFGDFTVEENLRMGLLGKPGLGSTVPEWAYDVFPILKERRSQQAGTMSGGQQQQLAIMRALLGQPDLLILDEPSEGIQPSIVHDIGVALREYARAHGLTVLLVEQNLDLVGLLGHHALFMENGAIVERIDDMARLQNDSELIARYLSV